MYAACFRQEGLVEGEMEHPTDPCQTRNYAVWFRPSFASSVPRLLTTESKKRPLNSQRLASEFVIDESRLLEPLHEETNARPCGAHHFCQRLLTDPGNRNFGLSVFAEVRQQEENTSQSFLTGIEKLINQILFVSDVPDQQIGHEHVGKYSFAVNHVHHGFLADSHYRAIGHCACGTHSEGLSCKATFSEKVALVQNS